MSTVFNWGLLRDATHHDFLLVDALLVVRTREGTGEWWANTYTRTSVDAALDTALMLTEELEQHGYEMLMGVYAAPLPERLDPAVRAHLTGTIQLSVPILVAALAGRWELVR